jgi:hypothetical protein
MDRMKTASLSRIGLLSSVALAAVVVVVSATGCSTGQANPAKIRTEFVTRDESGDTVYLQKVPADMHRVNWQNYKVGERTEAKVGEPIIAVRNYTAGDRIVRSFPLHDFAQPCKLPRDSSSMAALSEEEREKLACSSNPLSYMRGSTDSMFQVAGAFQRNGNVYYLNPIDTPDGTLFFATDREGRLKPGRYLSWRSASKTSIVTQYGIPLEALSVKVPLDDQEPLVRYETEEHIVPESSDYVHYELLFAGTTYDQRGMVYHFLYKEFRRGGKQIPIYTKQLEFTKRKTTIDLLGRKIRVFDVNDDRIAYSVQMD